MIIKMLYAISALDGLSFAMTMVTITPYIRTLGGTHFYMGLIGSMFSLVALIWSPISGSLSDSIGRKPLLLRSLFICIIANLLLIWTKSLTMIFFSRFLTAFGVQIMTLIKSLIDDNMESKEKSMAAINKLGAISGISFIVGSLLAGFLSDYEDGAKFAFSVITAMFVTNFALVYFFIKEKPKTKKTDDETPQENELVNALKNLTKINWPKFWDIFMMKGVFELTWGMFHFNSGIVLQDQFNATGKTFGYMFSGISVVIIITSLTLEKVNKRYYSQDSRGLTRLLHGSVTISLIYLVLSFTSNFNLYMSSILVMGVCKMFLDTTLTEIILKRTSDKEKGSIMATFDSLMQLAGLIAPLLSAILTEQLGFNVALLCAFPMLIAVSVMYSQKEKTL